MSSNTINVLISYHTFMFPFEFAYGKENNKIGLNKILEKMEENNQWEHKGSFDINKVSDDNIPNYNEYYYFNEQARRILYEKKCIKRGCKNTKCKGSYNGYCIEKSESFYFLKKNAKTFKYIIKIKSKTYTLDVSDISLRIFKHGIGILCFHLENRTYNSLDDILNINQYGRRIYPPFLKYNIINQKLSSKTVELAINITIKDNTNNTIKTNFQTLDANKRYDEKLGFIIKNLPSCFVESASKNKKKIQINPILDDRMFVVCWYGDDSFSIDLARKSSNNLKYDYEFSDKWYEFLFVERPGSITCQNDTMKEDLIKKSTYQRWIDYKTFFGITRYSFVCVTNSYSTLISNSAVFLIDHMRTLYYQMIVLSFIQRISILRFKERIENALENDDRNKFEIIHKHYLNFINKICLREVTSQEQGIEMYDLMKNIMGINESSKELKEEIEELFNLATYKKENETNNKLNLLAIIGGALGVSSLLASIMSLNNTTPSTSELIFIGAFLFLTICLSFKIWMLIRVKNSILNIILKLLIIITILAMISITIFYLFSNDILISNFYNSILKVIDNLVNNF